MQSVSTRKRWLICALICVLILAIFCSCTDKRQKEESEITKLLASGAELEYGAIKLISLNAERIGGTLYKQMQGGCTDGKYMYFAMNDTLSTDSLTVIYRFPIGQSSPDLISEPLRLDHANDMTYHEGIGRIIVVHNAPNRTMISFLNPETLTVVGTATLPLEIFSMQYNARRKLYVVGISGGQDFAFLDENFHMLRKFEVESTGYTTQGVDADDEYIYFVQYNLNVVVIYDWEGKRQAIIPLAISMNEPENIFHADGLFYVGCAKNGLNCFGIYLRKKDLSST